MADPSDASDLKLVWTNVKDGDRLEFSLEQELRIGRNKQNDVQIPDQLVSGQHCVIKHGQLIDARSTNGTTVNGEEIARGELRELRVGDIVQVGDTKLHVCAGKPYSNAEGDSSGSDSDDGEGAVSKDISMSGLDWYDAAPKVNGGDDDEIVETKASAAKQDKKVHNLQKQVEALRTDNIKLRQQLNPMRLRQQKKKDKAKEEKLMTTIQDLQHQVFYGEEMRTIQDEQLRLENDSMKKEIASKAREIESIEKKLEFSEQLVSRQQEEIDMLRRQRDERQKTVARLREEQLHLRSSSTVSAIDDGGNGGGVGDSSGTPEALKAEVRLLRESTQKLFVTVVLFLTVVMLMVTTFAAGRPEDVSQFIAQIRKSFGV